ncbi:hypothetical protein JST97_11900 [bacterium]|nr:hypothetical protein [bacterium]
MKHPITAEGLLWGLRDHHQGNYLAQQLALEVLPRLPGRLPGPTLSLTQTFALGALVQQSPELDWPTLESRAEGVCLGPAGPLLTDLATSLDNHFAELGVDEGQRGYALFLAGGLRQLQVVAERRAWLRNPDHPQYGLACGSYLRPEALFSQRTQTVVYLGRDHANPTGLEEVTVGKLKVVSLEQFFLDKDQVVVGFGKPNVFTLVPADNGYQKLDAFMFFRKKARMVWSSVVQSGIFIRPRKLPEGSVDALWRALRAQRGKRSFSCAQANAIALTEAGFTSGGAGLEDLVRPQALFMRIIKEGLEFGGQPVIFDILNTTPVTAEEHFEAVLAKERRSPISYLEKLWDAGQKSEAEIESLKAARALKAVAAPNTPVLAGAPLRVRNSRPSDLGMVFRQIWGHHVLWEALPDPEEINIDEYLPEVLVDKFTLAKAQGRKLKSVDRLKSVMFSREMIESIRESMTAHFDDMGSYQPGQIKAMVPAAAMGEDPILFNLVICGPKVLSRISITRIEGESKAPDWVLSKHVLISAYDPDVRYAGEIWAERFVAPDQTEQLRFHLNNNSGTYHPSQKQLEGAAAYLRALFPGVELQAHPVVPPSPAKQDVQKSYQVPNERYDSIKEKLNGLVLELGSERYSVRALPTLELYSEYFDTADGKLARAGAQLRARTRVGDSGRVKEIELEAKLDGKRVKGASFDSAESWESARQAILDGVEDPAVMFVRSLTQEPLLPSSWKRTRRALFGVAQRKPLGLGWLTPAFILSLDCSRSPECECWYELQPQIFTKLPWTKNIDLERLNKFDELCSQLESRFELCEQVVAEI